MKNLIYPLPKEDHVSSYLKQEEKRRKIPIIPHTDGYLLLYVRVWLELKLNIKKLLNKLWKRKYQQ